MIHDFFFGSGLNNDDTIDSQGFFFVFLFFVTTGYIKEDEIQFDR